METDRAKVQRKEDGLRDRHEVLHDDGFGVVTGNPPPVYLPEVEGPGGALEWSSTQGHPEKEEIARRQSSAIFSGDNTADDNTADDNTGKNQPVITRIRARKIEDNPETLRAEALAEPRVKFTRGRPPLYKGDPCLVTAFPQHRGHPKQMSSGPGVDSHPSTTRGSRTLNRVRCRDSTGESRSAETTVPSRRASDKQTPPANIIYKGGL
ncbi:hypothetical protein AAG570_003648 [Ranatra chinensis]|uniref:Uncharacterized protein n=1 Tax=Ranatra chinensis TaxID=642074 RepID=A0ABD0YR14_9HEMI